MDVGFGPDVGLDPSAGFMGGDFSPSSSDAAQQGAAVSQSTWAGGGFLGEGVPTGISGWDYQTPSGQTLAGLRDLQGQGLGSQATPTGQTVDQAVASLNLARGLDFAAPYAIQSIPGVSTALTASGLLQGQGFGAFNPLNTLNTIRDAVSRNQMELQTAQQQAFTNAQTGRGGGGTTAGGMLAGAGGGGTAVATPTISPTLGNIPGGVSGLSAGLPGGRGYSDVSGAWGGGPGAAGAAGGFGGRESEGEDEEEKKRRSGMFSTTPAFEEGGMIGPGGTPMIGGMPDPGRMPTGIGLQMPPQAGAANPQMAGMQARQFAQQNPQQLAEIRQEIMQAMQSGELQPQALNMVTQLSQVVSQNPDMYPYVRGFLIQQGIMDEDDLPPQFDPAVGFLLDLVAEAARGMSGSAASAQGAAPPMESMAQGGTVPDSKKRSGGVIIEAHEGEYVIPAHIVRQKGTDFFDKLIGKDVKSEKGAA